MFSISNVLSKTVGKILPRYKTFSEFCVLYKEILTTKQVTEKTMKNRLNYLQFLEETFGKRTLCSIKPFELQRAIHNLAKVHQSKGKRVMIEIKCLFNEALNEGWIDVNPTVSIRVPKVVIQRNRLTLEQFKVILTEAGGKYPPWVKHLMLLAVVTGQRRSDILKMKFSDIWENEGEQCLHITQQKTGSMVSIPLSLYCKELDTTVKQVVDNCRTYYKKQSDLMIRKADGRSLADTSLSFRFMQVRNNAYPQYLHDLAAPSLHECRSLSERIYRAQGIDTRVLLGHKSQRMTDLYNSNRNIKNTDWSKVKVSFKTNNN